MRRIALLGAICVALAGQAIAAPNIAKGELSARPGNPPLSLASGETKLASGSVYYRPATLPPGPRPLLMILHGYGQDNLVFLQSFEPWADRCGAILFAPRAKKVTWDMIASAQSLQSSRSAPREAPRKFGPDVPRIDSELATLFASAPIDSTKIVLFGFSDGASYSLSLGLANPELFPWVVALSPGFALWPNRVALSQHVFIAHGHQDDRLAFANTRDGIVAPLRQAKVPVEFREFDGKHVMKRDHIREALKLSIGCAAPA